MAIKTTEEQLTEVQNAISALLAGAQSYTLDGRTVTRGSLKYLNEREEMLLKRYRAESKPTNKPIISNVNFAL